MATEAGALLPAFADPTDRVAVRFDGREATYRQLAASAGRVAARIAGASAVAVWATPSTETAAAIVGALASGVPIIPLNPKSGGQELGHIVTDSAPAFVLSGFGVELPPALAAIVRINIDPSGPSRPRWPLPAPDKRPRVVHYLDALPRNDLGKVLKHALGNLTT